MQKDIHPKYHPVTFKFPDGESIVIGSTYHGKDYLLETKFTEHHAWAEDGKGTAKINEKAGKVADFNKKFGKLFGEEN